MDIVSKKNLESFIIAKKKITGTIEATSSPILQEKTVIPSTEVQSITAGNGYDGLSKVTVNAMPTATQATPSITISSDGVITASAMQSAGYVAAGTKSATKQLTTQAAETITPSTANQTAVASGRYTTGAITVKGDTNLVAGNIKSGTTIFGVTGTYVDSTPIEISTDAEMEAVLTSNNVGKVYKFTGISDTYTNGDLYIVEVG